MAPGGYGAVLLLDTWALLTRADLRAGEEYMDAGQNTYVAVNSINTVSHQARVTAGGCKLNANLAYSGATSGQYSDQVTLAGDLNAEQTRAP